MSKTIPEQLAEAQAALLAANTQIKTLTEQAASFNVSVEALTKTVAEHVATIATLTQERDSAKAELATANSTVNTLKAEAKTASERATHMVGRTGVNPIEREGNAAKPAADLTLDEVRSKLATCKDPVEKGRLAQLAQKIRAKG